MIITIIAEPRSGSTNLANWFDSLKNTTTLFEPITLKNTKWYQNESEPKLWKYNTDHLVVKEIYKKNVNFDDLIRISSKVIFLYRINIIQQIESWCNAKKTNRWHSIWPFKKSKFNIDDIEKNFIIELKDSFKKKFLDNKDNFIISYEELYYGDGIKKIINYVGLDELNNKKFPVGHKYRVDVTDTEKLI